MENFGEIVENSATFGKIQRKSYKNLYEEAKKYLEQLVQTGGVAHCYDRYCHDDDWEYCIFCDNGLHNPEDRTWKHAEDCAFLLASKFLHEKETL